MKIRTLGLILALGLLLVTSSQAVQALALPVTALGLGVGDSGAVASHPARLAAPAAALPHPRMFFSAGDIAQLRQAGNTTHADIKTPILYQAASLLSAPVPGVPTTTGEGPFYSAANDLLTLAFAYELTGDSQYSAKTRDYLLAYAAWPYWGADRAYGDRDLGLAAMIRANAVVYDWMYPQLTEADRAAVRTALGNYTEAEYVAATSAYNTDWYNWWGKSYVQNHWSTNNASIGIAALALEGEDARTDTWLSHARAQLEKDTFILEHLGDGSWHEGFQYQNSKFDAPLQFYYNLERLKGVDLMPHAYFERVVIWRLYNRLPGQVQYSRPFPGCVLPYSSYVHEWGGWNVGGGEVLLRFVASQERNAYAEWLAQQDRAAYGPRVYWNAAEYVFEFLYYDATLLPVEPDLPLSQAFTDLEGVIWRTGWEGNDLVFGFKTGAYGGRFAYTQYLSHQYPFDDPGGDANVGHGHGDANSFYLFRGSVDLASELADKSDPANESAMHNTLLVDGQDQYRSTWHNTYPGTDGRLEAVYETPGFNYLVADATNRYRTRGNGVSTDAPGALWLTEFRRYVLFVRPGYFVMVDKLRSDTPHQYDWVAHFSETKPAPVTVEGDWVKAPASITDVLGIKVLAPLGFTYAISASVHPYTDPPVTKPYIHLQSPASITDTRFVTVLYPTTQTDWAGKPAITLLANTAEAAGVRVTAAGTQDQLFNYGSTGPVMVGEYGLTGTVASVAKDNLGNLSRIFLGNGLGLSEANGARLLLQAARALTVEVVYSGPALTIYGINLNGLWIYAPDANVGQVTTVDYPASVSKAGDYIVLTTRFVYLPLVRK